MKKILYLTKYNNALYTKFEQSLESISYALKFFIAFELSKTHSTKCLYH